MKNLDEIRRLRSRFSYPLFTSAIWQYIVATLTIVISSWICFHFTEYIGYQSISFILLLVVSILAIFMGIGPITLACSLSTFIWNFFFIPSKFTMVIDKTEDALMFGMFYIIALVTGVLTSRVRRQKRLTCDREERTNALYQLTMEQVPYNLIYTATQYASVSTN